MKPEPTTAWELPKTIALPGDAVAYALTRLIAELWDQERFERLLQDSRHRGARMSIDDLSDRSTALKRALRTSWWKRLAFAQQLDEDTQRFVAWRLQALCAAAESCEWLRVPTRGFRRWVADGQIQRAKANAESRDLQWSLSLTVCYFDWIERGGDADLARYLALYNESSDPDSP